MDFASLGKTIAGNFSSWANQIFSSLKIGNPYLLALDIILTAIIIYWFLSKIVETKAVRVLYGLIVLFVLYGISQILNLSALNWMLKYLSLAVLIAIPIIFHPEIRAALERLGGSGFKRLWKTSKALKKEWIKEIVKATEVVSNAGIGGLIVIENQTPLIEYMEKGVRLGGEISTSLIESVFSAKSNLKDGALIISKGEIAAAKVVLPVSATQSGVGFGARHLAGINITEETDAISIIISATGRISIAWHGRIREASPSQVRSVLKEFWGIK